MSREEYLNQLHKHLRKLPRQDYEDAMEYFTEYFQETDEEEAAELMKELGTPKEAARELMANLLDKKIEDHQSYEADGQTRAEQKGSGKHVVWIALLVLFAAPVGVPLLRGLRGRPASGGHRTHSQRPACLYHGDPVPGLLPARPDLGAYPE